MVKLHNVVLVEISGA